MLDPSNPKKVAEMVKFGFQKMETRRKSRLASLCAYAGSSSGPEAAVARPINKMWTAINTYVSNLVYNDPRARVKANQLYLTDYAYRIEGGLDHLVKEIKLRKTLRMCVVDALVGVGIVKMGLGISGQTVEHMGSPIDVGQFFCDRVDIDDFFIDPTCRDIDESMAHGNAYRVPKQQLIEDPSFPDKDKIVNLKSDWQADLSKSAQGIYDRKTTSSAADVVEMVELVDAYLPHSNMVVTLEKDGNEYLRVVESWEGPEWGPYRLLGFAWVPDNPLPVAPAGIWLDLDVMINEIARHIKRQAGRQKRIVAYESSAIEDAKNMEESEDGDYRRVDNIDKIKEITIGGTTEDAYEFERWGDAKFAEISGNVDVLAGQTTDDPTLGQAQMRQENTQVNLNDAQNAVYNFTGEIMEAARWYMHTDPLLDMTFVRRRNGRDEQINLTAEMREGDFIDLSTEVVPYSMARQDPNTRLRRGMEMLSTVIPAIAQATTLLAPIGIRFKPDTALAWLAREANFDGIDEFVEIMPTRHWAELRAQGLIPDGNAVQEAQNQQAPMGTGGQPSVNVGQPNPGQMGPTGGISPQTEQNTMQQEFSAPLQPAAQGY